MFEANENFWCLSAFIQVTGNMVICLCYIFFPMVKSEVVWVLFLVMNI